MQSSDNFALKTLLFFGERLALLIVVMAFFSIFFFESVHPAFSKEEEVYLGYSKGGLTYDYYLSSSYSDSVNFESDVSTYHSEVSVEEHVVIEEVKVETNTPGDIWDKLAACESGGNWNINTNNGYYGGLQFSQGAWNSAGGSGLPSDASREEQIERGKALQSMRGWGVWGLCSKKLGL